MCVYLFCTTYFALLNACMQCLLYSPALQRSLSVAVRRKIKTIYFFFFLFMEEDPVAQHENAIYLELLALQDLALPRITFLPFK